MAASRRNKSAWLSICATGLACGAASAAEINADTIDYVADHQIVNTRENATELAGDVRVTQGKNTVSAERASFRSLRSGVSEWRFEEALHLQTPEAELRAQTATGTFNNGVLTHAQVRGAPAEFTQLNGVPEERGRGRASTIDYDVNEGRIKLIGNSEPVWFVYGKDKSEIRTTELTYNLRDGSVATGRVRGTIRVRDDELKLQEPTPAPAESAGNGA